MREREEKVVELARERALDQRGSQLEKRSKPVEELEEEMETHSGQLGGFNASISALGSNSWPITLLWSVVFRMLGDKTSSFLFCSRLPSSNPSSFSNPNSSLPPPPLLLKLFPKEDPDATGKPDAIYASQQVAGGLPRPCWRAMLC